MVCKSGNQDLILGTLTAEIRACNHFRVRCLVLWSAETWMPEPSTNSNTLQQCKCSSPNFYGKFKKLISGIKLHWAQEGIAGTYYR